MVVRVDGSSSDCREVQPQKVLWPREVMPSGTRKDVRLSQTSNALRPMVVMVAGCISTVANCLQYWKAYSSITVTLEGMVMEGRVLQLAKAYVPMVVSVEGSTTLFKASSS